MKLPHMYLIRGRQCVNTKISSLICEVDLFVHGINNNSNSYILFYPIKYARHYSKNFTWVISSFHYIDSIKVGSSHPFYAMMLKTNMSVTWPRFYSGP